MRLTSLQTKICGILSLLGTGIIAYYPEHTREGLFITTFCNGLGLLFARSNGTTSEDVKASQAPPAP